MSKHKDIAELKEKILKSVLTNENYSNVVMIAIEFSIGFNTTWILLNQLVNEGKIKQVIPEVNI